MTGRITIVPGSVVLAKSQSSMCRMLMTIPEWELCTGGHKVARNRKRRMYVEQKTADCQFLGGQGPATITDVSFSKSGKSLYYKGRRLAKCTGSYGNYYDVDNGDEFWVSGVKAGK